MSIATTEDTTTLALLISIRTPNVTQQEVDESLSELGRLVNTLGFSVVGSKTQRQRSTKQLSVLGSGKLEELAALTNDDELPEQDETADKFESVDFDQDELNDLIMPI